MTRPILLAHTLSWAFASCVGCATAPDQNEARMTATTPSRTPGEDATAPGERDTITLGAGCFWCVEAVFLELRGVHAVMPGYMGGRVEHPTYEAVCTGKTGHAEVARVVFDPAVLPLEALLEVFWRTHDPTTLDRQGADVGSQYRSAIFHHTAEQGRIAEGIKADLDRSGAFRDPIVTEIVPASTFYPAEDYHRDYYARNGDQGYCRMVIAPKLEKFRKVFADRLKER